MAEPEPSEAPRADTYTHGHAESVLRSHTWRTIANSARYVEPWLVPGAVVLDIGCGPGTISTEMATRVTPGRVIAIDVSSDVVAKAAAHAAAAGVANIEFRVGDGYALDLPDASVDVVHAHQVLQHVSDPVAMLREMRRVCRPDGVVAVRDADYAAMAWYPEIPEIAAWLDGYRKVARHNEAEPDAGRHLVAWANAAGFDSVTPSADTWCFATPDDRAWWGGLWADRVIGSSLADQAVEYDIATRDDLMAWSDAFRRWAEHPDSWFIVVNGEVLLRP